MLKLDSFDFTNCEEVDRVEIYEPNAFEIQNEPACSSTNLCFQVLYIAGFNSPAQPENRVRPMRRALDL